MTNCNVCDRHIEACCGLHSQEVLNKYFEKMRGEPAAQETKVEETKVEVKAEEVIEVKPKTRKKKEKPVEEVKVEIVEPVIEEVVAAEVQEIEQPQEIPAEILVTVEEPAIQMMDAEAEMEELIKSEESKPLDDFMG